MKRICFGFFLLTSSFAYSQREMNSKVAQIISFRIESKNPGIDNQTLLLPLSQQLTELFRFADLAMADNTTIQWKGESPFNKFKKLSKKELQLTSSDNNVVLLKIEIEHRYNPVLGGIISKSRRHVMKLRIALFTSTGKRVWYHKRPHPVHSAIWCALVSSWRSSQVSRRPSCFLGTL